jgi:hypothetical protein
LFLQALGLRGGISAGDGGPAAPLSSRTPPPLFAADIRAAEYLLLAQEAHKFLPDSTDAGRQPLHTGVGEH